MISLRPYLMQLLLSGWLCLPGPALADNDADTARRLRAAGEILPLETILQRLQSGHPGKVLEVELEKKRDRMIYEIELLDGTGRVRELEVDAQSGELLKHEPDD